MTIAVFALVLLVQNTPPAVGGVKPAVEQSRYSDCILNEVARLEKTTVSDMKGFSRRNASKAFGTCQAVKASWANEIDQELLASGNFNDAKLRLAKVHQVISIDELSVLLLVQTRGR